MMQTLEELKTDLADSRAKLTRAIQEGADEEEIDAIQCHIDHIRGEIKKARRKARRAKAHRAEFSESPAQEAPADDSPIDVAAAVRRILGHGDDADRLF